MVDWRSHGASGYASTASRPTLAWGAIPIVALAEARTKALENARTVDQGRDRATVRGCLRFEPAVEKVTPLLLTLSRSP